MTGVRVGVPEDSLSRLNTSALIGLVVVYSRLILHGVGGNVELLNKRPIGGVWWLRIFFVLFFAEPSGYI